MYGCPYGYIYTSADTVEQLLGNANFSYQPGVFIDQVRESAQGAELLGYDEARCTVLALRPATFLPNLGADAPASVLAVG